MSGLFLLILPRMARSELSHLCLGYLLALNCSACGMLRAAIKSIHLFSMGRCSSCGTDLSGCEKLCHECDPAQQAASIIAEDNSSHNWTAYAYLLLWIAPSYAFVTCTPDSAKVGVSSGRPCGRTLFCFLGLFAKTTEETYDSSDNFFLRSWPLLWRGVEDNWRGCLDETRNSLHIRERWL